MKANLVPHEQIFFRTLLQEMIEELPIKAASYY